MNERACAQIRFEETTGAEGGERTLRGPVASCVRWSGFGRGAQDGCPLHWIKNRIRLLCSDCFTPVDLLHVFTFFFMLRAST